MAFSIGSNGSRLLGQDRELHELVEASGSAVRRSGDVADSAAGVELAHGHWF